jgi:hypothetical protein
MSLLAKTVLLRRAQRLARENATLVHQGIDRTAALVRGKAGAQHAAKVDQGAALLKRLATGSTRPSGR